MGKCSAKSKRSKEQCQKWAVRGRMTCRMHGDTSKGPKTKAGRERSRLAVLKNGNYTKEVRTIHQEAMALIRQNKDLLRQVCDSEVIRKSVSPLDLADEENRA